MNTDKQLLEKLGYWQDKLTCQWSDGELDFYIEGVPWWSIIGPLISKYKINIFETFLSFEVFQGYTIKNDKIIICGNSENDKDLLTALKKLLIKIL